MTDSLYKEHILDHYRNPRNFGKLPGASFAGNAANPWCGDAITLFVKFDARGGVETASFEGAGCAVSTAAASLLTEDLKNKCVAELSALEFDDIQKLLNIEISEARTACAELPLNALREGLKIWRARS